MYCVIVTPLGKMQARSNGKFITHLHFCDSPIRSHINAECISLFKHLQNQINAYFAGQLKQFSILYQADGSPFQNKVWNALMKIPYGQTSSYAEIGQCIDSPKALQAIGQANKKNPIQIIIPCHRVIKKNNDLGGYVAGIGIKEFLIYHESYYFSQ